MQGLTYKRAGVDIRKASVFKRGIRSLVRTTFRPEVLRDIGGFGSFFDFSGHGYRQPVLVSSTDGVGTKLLIASLAGTHDTVGIDLVAMNVNDILCVGAEPLFFLDYIASGKLDPAVLKAVVRGIARGCAESGCSLIGGETAEMPDFYEPGGYDLAGFCVGAVEKGAIIDGSRIAAGDVLLGLASSGLHSNGYSLVRKVFSAAQMKRMSGELLKPTRIYVRPVLSLLRDRRFPREAIKGISHITGGAFYDKIARILPPGAAAHIRKSAWEVPAIFRLIQQQGRVPEEEMYRTLNMGIGLVVFVAPQHASRALEHFNACGIATRRIGTVERGRVPVSIE